MRTVIIIVIGLAFMALAMRFTKPPQRVVTAWLFSLAWLLVVAWNLSTGMSHGYSFQEELPIQVVIFVVPVLGAWFLSRKGRKR